MSELEAPHKYVCSDSTLKHLRMLVYKALFPKIILFIRPNTFAKNCCHQRIYSTAKITLPYTKLCSARLISLYILLFLYLPALDVHFYRCRLCKGYTEAAVGLYFRWGSHSFSLLALCHELHCMTPPQTTN